MNRKGQRLDLRPGCSHSMAASWAHRWPLVVTLHSQVTRSELWGTAGRQVGRWGEPGVSGFLGRLNGPASVQALSADHLHTPCRPLANPCPPLAYLLCTQVRGQPNPLVLLAVQGVIGHSRPPRCPQQVQQGPPGGVLEPRRVCVSHSHFWTKIVTPSSPPLTPSSPPLTPTPPPSPTFLLRRTPG